jgi:DNA-binding LytR/AlgR family response regulator
VHIEIQGFLRNSDKAEIVHCYERCTDFLEKADKLSYDLVFLDCLFPNDTKGGVDVALRLKEIGKDFIFISAKHRSFVEACRAVGALDAMPKPLTEKRLTESIDKAFHLMIGSSSKLQKNALFHVKELKGEINIYIPEILYVRTASPDARNKLARLKNNINYTLMDCKFNDLLDLSPDFAMANKSELLSYEIVECITGELISLKQNDNNKIPKSIPLSPNFKDTFKYKFH